MLSVAIMAHPKRSNFVAELEPQLPGAKVVWDQKNDRWDTGRRAMLAYDPDAEWHLVVQDDAVLCPHFLEAARAALASAPAEVPVSFYTGKVRPYTRHVERAVNAALEAGLTWFKMRGPLWGPAIAVPVALIERMVAESDPFDTPSYDMRLTEWFWGQGILCWYSVPSLVNHRVGPENPSLVPGRGSGLGRTAYSFAADGRGIRWGSEAYVPGDPSEWWTEEGTCTRCWARQDGLTGAIIHAVREHGLEGIEFLATTPYHAERLAGVRDELPEELRGTLYVVGYEVSEKVKADHVRLRPGNARKKMSRGRSLVITGAARDLRYLAERPGWSITEGEPN